MIDFARQLAFPAEMVGTQKVGVFVGEDCVFVILETSEVVVLVTSGLGTLEHVGVTVGYQLHCGLLLADETEGDQLFTILTCPPQLQLFLQFLVILFLLLHFEVDLVLVSTTNLLLFKHLFFTFLMERSLTQTFTHVQTS